MIVRRCIRGVCDFGHTASSAAPPTVNLTPNVGIDIAARRADGSAERQREYVVHWVYCDFSMVVGLMRLARHAAGNVAAAAVAQI